MRYLFWWLHTPSPGFTHHAFFEQIKYFTFIQVPTNLWGISEKLVIETVVCLHIFTHNIFWQYTDLYFPWNWKLIQDYEIVNKIRLFKFDMRYFQVFFFFIEIDLHASDFVHLVSSFWKDFSKIKIKYGCDQEAEK